MICRKNVKFVIVIKKFFSVRLQHAVFFPLLQNYDGQYTVMLQFYKLNMRKLFYARQLLLYMAQKNIEILHSK